MSLGLGKAFKFLSLDILPKVKLKTTGFSFYMHSLKGGLRASITILLAYAKKSLSKGFPKVSPKQ